MKRIYFVLALCTMNVSFAQEADSLTTTWELKCYPNPTSDLLVVNSNIDIKEVQIIDLSGAVVKASPMPNWCFSLHDLPSGWLFVYVISTDGRVEKKNIYKN